MTTYGNRGGFVNGLSISEFFGSEIIITNRITKIIQARCHKKSRINKKWLKRYGYKNIPDDNKCLVVGNRVFMTQRAFERINKRIEGDRNDTERNRVKNRRTI